MIGAIMGVGSGKSFAAIGTFSADLPSDISAFPMATHPWEMVNHPEEDSSSKSSRCPYLLWTWTGSLIDLPCPCGGPLESWSFEVLLVLFFCLVEPAEEFEILTEVVAVWEELDVLCDGVTIFSFGLPVSRVGFSVFSIQVTIVWVSLNWKHA